MHLHSQHFQAQDKYQHIAKLKHEVWNTSNHGKPITHSNHSFTAPLFKGDINYPCPPCIVQDIVLHTSSSSCSPQQHRSTPARQHHSALFPYSNSHPHQSLQSFVAQPGPKQFRTSSPIPHPGIRVKRIGSDGSSSRKFKMLRASVAFFCKGTNPTRKI